MAGDRADPTTEQHLSAPSDHLLGVGPGDAGEVDDGGAGDQQGPGAGGVRLHLLDFLRPQLGHPLHAVADGPFLQGVQPLELTGTQRHDQLPAAFIGDGMPVGELLQLDLPGQAQLRLQRARRVIHPRVDDAGVVTALVGGDPVLLVEDGDSQIGAPAEELVGSRQAEQAGADDHDVE